MGPVGVWNFGPFGVWANLGFGPVGVWACWGLGPLPWGPRLGSPGPLGPGALGAQVWGLWPCLLEQGIEEAEPAPAAAIVLPDDPIRDFSIDIGLNRLTAIANKNKEHMGWEASCNHPAHNIGVANCRINRRFGKKYFEQLLAMLKVWLALGLNEGCEDAATHIALWAAVEALVRNDELPDDVPPVEDWNERRNCYGYFASEASGH
jgi:hypothetical protein